MASPESAAFQPAVFAGCYRGVDMDLFPRSVSNISECVQVCREPGFDDPYFMMLFHDPNFKQKCGCSSYCSLRQTGESLYKVTDQSCGGTSFVFGEPLMGGTDGTYIYHAIYSIRPESVSCSPAALTTPLNRTTVILACIGLAINLLILVALLLFMLAFDAAGPETAGISRLSQFLSPFNLQLLLMTSSLIGVFSCLLDASKTALITSLPAELVFSEIFKASFLLCGWGRGATVINSVWPRGMKPCFIFLSSVQKSGQSTLDPNYFRNVGPSIEMASIALVALIDFGLLSCFIVYIRANTRVSNTDAIAPRFLKICYYGTAANVICGGAFITYLIRFAFMKWNYHSAMYDFQFEGVIHLIFTAVLGTLVGLKVALHSDSESEKLRKKSVYERARFIATGNGVESHPIPGSRMGSKISSPSVCDSRG
ncbi:hypothetical protein BJ741DRAFT_614151 [Chytriomyces cf. hyalinus JEL632]|nr:hypothetical protein BJ741DRAFT_614151 [Chytriomyces cf. hyalinus JEL632]